MKLVPIGNDLEGRLAKQMYWCQGTILSAIFVGSACVLTHLGNRLGLFFLLAAIAMFLFSSSMDSIDNWLIRRNTKK